MATTGQKPSGEGEGGPEFQGTVVRNPVDALAATTGVSGPHQVWFPASKADVAAAVAGTQGLRTFVRSGMRAEAGDTIDAAGGAVINLTALKGVSVTKDVVHAEAAATARSVARRLAESGLALPLAYNPQQSIASGVLHGGPSCLMRTLGPLSDYVSALEVVTPAGELKTLSGLSALGDARDGNAVITDIAFKPIAAEGLWMVRKSFPYPEKERFAAIVKALFLDEPFQPLPPRCDLVLDAY